MLGQWPVMAEADLRLIRSEAGFDPNRSNAASKSRGEPLT
jgi:hypothetical protein